MELTKGRIICPRAAPTVAEATDAWLHLESTLEVARDLIGRVEDAVDEQGRPEAQVLTNARRLLNIGSDLLETLSDYVAGGEDEVDHLQADGDRRAA
ncbi:hypothetical protein [Rhodoligotrophos ferricapiens]|uniref:hypothetical protein n=1 Tax=Rhodoligotrophos ferricapiens TaxID=3069264 RepID=UPI00315CA245